MTELVLSAVFKADGSGLVGQVRISEAELKKLKQTTAETGAAARKAAIDTEAQTQSVTRSTQAVQQNAHVLAFHARQQKIAADAARDARIRYQQLGFQIQDISASFASGINPAMIFAQQGGQIASAMANAGGKIGAVASFLAGPWGAAISGAVAIGGVLLTQWLAGNDALDKQAEKTKTLADAIKELDEVSGRASKTEAQKIALAIEHTRQLLNQEVATRRLTRAKLEDAIADARSTDLGSAVSADTANQDISNRQGRVERLEKQLADQDRKIAAATQSLRGGIAKASLLNIAAATDKATAATQKYESELGKLRKQFENGEISRGEFERQATAITRTRDAATESRKTSNAAQREAARLLRAETRELESLIETATKGFWAISNAAEKAMPGIGAARTFEEGDDQSRVDTGLAEAVERIESQRTDLGKDANREIWQDYQREGQEAINAIADLIGGKLGRAMSGVAALLNSGSAAASPGSFMAGFQSSSLASLFGGQPSYDPAAIRLKEAGGGDGALGGFSKKLDKIFGSSGSFTQTVGKAFGGAATGSAVNGVMSALGIKGSQTGAQIGGAIGSFIPIPGGDIIGSIAGSLIGGMFKKAPYGTANVTSVDGDASVKGNKGSARKVATGLAGSVQEGVRQIAEMLGGETDDFNVSIGTYKGKYRVSTTGYSGRLSGDRATGLVDFGKEGQADAVAYAIMDAVKDGGVKGLSAAVQKALQSDSDVNKAIEEALKVQQIEIAIGGIGAVFKKEFSDFERQAKERVKLAQKYGFEVNKIEELNAKERVKLTDKLLSSQVGSLQQLLDEMKSGSLFEGSAADQRSALLAQIEAAKKDAAAGVEGSGDRLAGLQRQLLDVTREGYGTAGGLYAGDRANVAADAQAIISKVTADLRTAQDAALAGQLEEANDLSAVTNAKLDAVNANLAGLPANLAAMLALRFGGVGAWPYSTVRT